MNAIDKIRDEMAKEPADSPIAEVGEMVTEMLTAAPDIAPAIMDKGKTLKGAYNKIYDKINDGWYERVKKNKKALSCSNFMIHIPLPVITAVEFFIRIEPKVDVTVELVGEELEVVSLAPHEVVSQGILWIQVKAAGETTDCAKYADIFQYILFHNFVLLYFRIRYSGQMYSCG